MLDILIAIFFFSFWTAAVYAEPGSLEFRIIAPEKSQAVLSVVEQIRVRFPNSRVIADATALPKRSPARYIAVGPAALQSLLAKDIEDPIFTVLVPSLVYREIIGNNGRGKGANVTAIFAEASPAAQLQLIARLFKSETQVGVLYTSKSAHLLATLRQAASSVNLRLNFVQVGDEGLNRALNRISDAPVLLALPDTTVYNAQNIQTILLTTYQRGQAVLGFSTSLVRAGALATTYSTVDDTISQLGELVDDYTMTGRMPAAQHPKYFSTFTNDSVSRSLDIVIDDATRKFSHRRTVR